MVWEMTGNKKCLSSFNKKLVSLCPVASSSWEVWGHSLMKDTIESWIAKLNFVNCQNWLDKYSWVLSLRKNVWIYQIVFWFH